MRTLNIETPTHGRVLIQEKTSGVNSMNKLPMLATPVVVGFHGYAQSAEDMMVELQALPGSDAMTLVSVQALNRFYTRGDSTIVANWMTRQDRDQAIADNIEYVNRALDQSVPAGVPVFVVGFSQGVAMAYRAALLGRHRIAGVVAVGGDVPPDVKSVPAERWPRVLIAAGRTDYWYTPDKVMADEAFLAAHGVTHEWLRYDAGHVFTDDVRRAIAAFFTIA